MTSLCIFSNFLYAGTTRVSKKNAGIHSLKQLRKRQNLLLYSDLIVTEKIIQQNLYQNVVLLNNLLCIRYFCLEPFFHINN
jgi:hypothetical protein